MVSRASVSSRRYQCWTRNSAEGIGVSRLARPDRRQSGGCFAAHSISCTDVIETKLSVTLSGAHSLVIASPAAAPGSPLKAEGHRLWGGGWVVGVWGGVLSVSCFAVHQIVYKLFRLQQTGQLFAKLRGCVEEKSSAVFHQTLGVCF